MAEEASQQNTNGAAAAASLPTADGAGGESIAKILKASGPVIKCVLLKHMRKTGKDAKPHVSMTHAEAEAVKAELHLSESSPVDDEKQQQPGSSSSPTKTPPPSPPVVKHHREVLTELIEEVEMDTTPKKQGAQTILGGPFTFVGQYPDQELVLMARADQIEDPTNIETLSVKELISLCKDSPDINYNSVTMLEKSDLVAAVRDAQLPVNPHKLQPPLNHHVVRGDILVIKVAKDGDVDDEAEEEQSDPETATAQAIADFTKMSAVSNEEFFLNYTKDEWIEFASRTDIVAPKMEAPSSEEEEEEEDSEEADEAEGDNGDDEDDDEDYAAGDDVPNEEEDRRALLNLILGEVLKKFRQENDRGPDSEELLELRRQVAAKLGLHLDEPTVDKKRPPAAVSTPPSAKAGTSSSPPSTKRVKFTPEVTAKADQQQQQRHHDHDDDGEGDKKPKASA